MAVIVPSVTARRKSVELLTLTAEPDRPGHARHFLGDRTVDTAMDEPEGLEEVRSDLHGGDDLIRPDLAVFQSDPTTETPSGMLTDHGDDIGAQLGHTTLFLPARGIRAIVLGRYPPHSPLRGPCGDQEFRRPGGQS